MLFLLFVVYEALDENYSRRDLLDWQTTVLEQEELFKRQGLKWLVPPEWSKPQSGTPFTVFRSWLRGHQADFTFLGACGRLLHEEGLVSDVPTPQQVSSYIKALFEDDKKKTRHLGPRDARGHERKRWPLAMVPVAQLHRDRGHELIGRLAALINAPDAVQQPVPNMTKAELTDTLEQEKTRRIATEAAASRLRYTAKLASKARREILKEEHAMLKRKAAAKRASVTQAAKEARARLKDAARAQ
eukprot:7386942-Prymnesium_polylepis.1